MAHNEEEIIEELELERISLINELKERRSVLPRVIRGQVNYYLRLLNEMLLEDEGDKKLVPAKISLPMGTLQVPGEVYDIFMAEVHAIFPKARGIRADEHLNLINIHVSNHQEKIK